jgi:hypothetical protein
MSSIRKELINLTIINNSNSNFTIPLFQNGVYTINSNIKYTYDITSASLACGQGDIIINGILYNFTYTPNVSSLATALTNLGFGFFSFEIIGLNTYIYVVDNTNVYGDMNLCLLVPTTTTTTTLIPTTTTTSTSTTSTSTTSTSTTSTSTSTTSTTTTAIPTTTTTSTSTTTTAIPTTTTTSTTSTSTSTTSTTTTAIPTTTTTSTSTTSTSTSTTSTTTTAIPTTTTTTTTSTSTSTTSTSTSTTSTTTTILVGECYTIENTDAVDISASYTDVNGNPACQAVPVSTTVYICVQTGTGGSIVLYLGTGCLSGSGSGIITSLGTICTTSGNCIPTTTTTTTTSTSTSTTTSTTTIPVVDCDLTDSSFGTSAIFNLGTISGNVTITGSGLTTGDTYDIIYPIGGSIIHTTTAVDGSGNLSDTFFWTYDSVNTNVEIVLVAP